MRTSGLVLCSFIILCNVSRATNLDVSVTNFAFNPQAITLVTGDTVTWSRVSGSHNVHHTGTPTRFHSGTVNGTWTTYVWPCSVGVGTYPYVCELHSGTMTGTVSVASITVMAPVGGETWFDGESRAISWNSTGLASAVNVVIEINRDYPGGPWGTLFASTPNDGSEYWIVTGASGSACRVRVRAVASGSVSENIVGISEADFTIPAYTPVWNGLLTGVGVNLRGLDFVDASWGWLCGLNGIVRRTTDGGDNWTSQTTGVATHLRDLDFIDRNRGWFVGDGGLVKYTSDGGANWIQQPTGVTVDFQGMHFLDADYGWAVGPNEPRVYRTTDGGASWNGHLTTASLGFDDVFFLDPLTGWAVGSLGVIQRTTDGGVSWIEQPSGTVQNLHAISFPDPCCGWIAGNGRTIARSTDGGLTWTSAQYGPSQSHMGLRFISPTEGWAGGDLGYIIHTVDGGDTWTTQYGPSVIDWYEFSFAGPQRGWVIGDGGAMRRYDAGPGLFITLPNGGETWTIGQPQFITWASQNITGNISVELNRDYPAGTWETLVASTANDGSEDWTASGLATSTARVRVSSLDNPVMWDESDANFEIYSSDLLSGPLSGSIGPGVYHVVDSIFVDSGMALTIQPGTTLLFGPHIFRVRGTLNAFGSASDSIVFTGDTISNPVGWDGIRLGAETESGDLSGTANLRFCRISLSVGHGVHAGHYCSVTAESSLFELNDGSGIYTFAATVNLNCCTIRYNGDGINCGLTTANINNCSVTQNGRGIFLGGAGPAFIRSCVVSQNASHGIELSDNNPTSVLNSTISGNGGHGIFDRYAPVTVSNCIVEGSGGTGIVIDEGCTDCWGGYGPATLSNNCIAGNALGGSSGSEVPVGVGEISTVNTNGDSCDQFLNVIVDPQMVDPSNADYRLIETSPCIGAGDASDAPPTDVLGNLRPSPVGSLPDIGAYEHALATPASWSPQNSGVSAHLSGVYFVGADTGWAVGAGGIIRYTTDGGLNWGAQSCPVDYDLNEVTFVNSSDGWIVGAQGTILHTSNGGLNWSTQTSNTLYLIEDVVFIDGARGWASGWGRTVLHTTDGGANWATQEVGGPGVQHMGIDFVNAQDGLMVSETGSIWRSTDGGANWVLRHQATHGVRDVVYTSTTRGCAVGGDGQIFTTTNGGDSWTLQTIYTGANYRSVAFADANNGWAVGSAGTIRRTTDGGLSWATQQSNTTCELFDVDFAAGHGWAVGVDGTILKYTEQQQPPSLTIISPNGGESWTVGQPQFITWASQNITGNVSIELTRDYPAGTWETLAASTANDGSEDWTASGLATSTARVRVSSLDNPAMWDESDANFEIGSNHSPNVTERGFAPTSGLAVAVATSGNYVYVATENGGLRVIDIANPTSPVEVGYYQTPGHARGVAVSGSYAYVADSDSGFRIINVSNPASPSQMGWLNTPGTAEGIALSGSYACIADREGGLRMVDVSNPALPVELDVYSAPAQVRQVAVRGSYAYVGAAESGLRIVEISNPAQLQEVGSCTTPGNAIGVAVSGNHAYVADWDYGLRVIDISNPAAPTQVGTYPTPGNAFDVEVVGAFAYLADYTSGLRIVDISNPAAPVSAGYYDTPGQAFGVAVAVPYTYVADYGQGLRIYQFGGSDTLSGNLSGTIGPGTYRVTGDISVAASMQLTIQPGTRLMFDGAFTFRVGGALLALGTASDSIIFTSSPSDPLRWHGLRIESTVDTSRLRYCRVENARAVTGVEPDDHGGGVFAYYASPVIEHCLITNCTAKHGGGIYLSHSSNGRVTDCVIANNSANPLSGGGMFIQEDSNPLIARCDIRQNTAGNDGGGVYVYLASPQIDECNLNGNSAVSQGGGFYFDSSPAATLDICTVTWNAAGDNGGGVYCAGGALSMDSCRVDSNRSFAYGGGLFGSAATLAVNRSSISGNNAAYSGGGLHVTGAVMQLQDCQVSTNTSDAAAGLFADAASEVSLERCEVAQNVASGDGQNGGGLQCEDAVVDAVNCVFHDNEASLGGGLFFSSSYESTLNFCTVVHNTGSMAGGGVWFGNGAQLNIRNSIIASNFNGGALYCDDQFSTPNLSDCNLWGNQGGDWSGCISGQQDSSRNSSFDPQFANVATGDFSLRDSSLCIGAGDTTGAPTTDFDGSLRPNPPGSLPDLGAFEHERGAPLGQDWGVVAYYPFNGDANDESGNNRNLTPTSVTYTADRFGHTNAAAHFNGSAYAANMTPNFTSHENGTFTIAAWVKLATLSQDGIVAAHHTTVSDAFAWSFGPWQQNFRLYAAKQNSGQGGEVNFPLTQMQADRWYHVAAVYDSSTLRIYRNGVLQGTATFPITDALHPQMPLSLGAAYVDGSGFLSPLSGDLDDVQLFGSALSATEIQALFDAPDPNPIECYWPLDGAATDSSNKNDLTPHDITYTTDRYGQSNSAAYFNGSSTYLSVEQPAFEFNPDQAFSVSLWSRFDSVSRDLNGPCTMFWNGTLDPGNFVWQLATQNSNVRFAGAQQQLDWHQADWNVENLGIGQWYHIAGVYQNRTFRLYVNGIERAASTALTEQPRAAVMPFTIGATHVAPGNRWGYFKGAIDEVRLLNRALIESEITTLATSNCPATPVPFADEFGGTLDGCWSWINEDPTHWSLTANPGWLQITTQVEPPRHNVLLRSRPNGNYAMETRVTISPERNHHSAGIVFWKANDHYIQFMRSYNDPDQDVWVQSTDSECGSADSVHYAGTETYLKVVVDPPLATFLWSGDGAGWQVLDTSSCALLSDSATRIGLFVTNGVDPTVPEIPAQFDYFRVTPYAPPAVTVTSPNGGELWALGEQHPITWSTQGSVANVKIELNRSYPGASWETLIGSTSNDGSYDWTLSGVASTTARIRISDAGNATISDTSDVDFSMVLPACPPTPVPFTDDFDGALDTCWTWLNEDTTYWNLTEAPGQLRIYMHGQTPGLMGTNTLLRKRPLGDFSCETQVYDYPGWPVTHGAGLLLYLDEQNWMSFRRMNTDTAYYVMAVEGNSTQCGATRSVYGGNWSLRVIVTGNQASFWGSGDGYLWVHVDTRQCDWLADPALQIGLTATRGSLAAPPAVADFDWFRVRTPQPPSITLTSTNGGVNQVLPLGAPATISWWAESLTGDVLVQLNRQYPNGPWETLDTAAVQNGGTGWTVTGPNTQNARMRLVSVDYPTVTDQSDSSFGIGLSLPENWSNQFCGLTSDFYATDFPDTSNGWVVGADGIILHTTDGGEEWTPQLSTVSVALKGVSFVTINDGWVVGDGGTILHTSNGGLLWQTQSSPFGGVLEDVKFLSPQLGWACGEIGTILRTTNGGLTWLSNNVGSARINAIEFTSPLLGWAVSENGAILRCFDGGINWNAQYSVGHPLYDIAFDDDTTGLAVGDGGAIYFTTNAGANWSAQGNFTSADLFGAAIHGRLANRYSAPQAWVVGADGAMAEYWMLNGVDPWNSLGGFNTHDLLDIVMVDANHIWAVGPGGTIVRYRGPWSIIDLTAPDGGDRWTLGETRAVTWTSQNVTGNVILELKRSLPYGSPEDGPISVPNTGSYNWTVTGPLTSKARIVVRSDYGGARDTSVADFKIVSPDGWESRHAETSQNLNDICFVDSSYGWGVGTNGAVRHTTDGGLTWTGQSSGVTSLLWGVYFRDRLNGWAVGYLGVIRHTTDGGNNWRGQSSGVTNELRGIAFANADTGWSVGGGVTLKTTNGGATWTPLAGPAGTFYELTVLNIDTVLIGGPSGVSHTFDGGVTWTTSPIEGLPGIFDAAVVDLNSYWLAGMAGWIARSTNGGATWTQQNSGTTASLTNISFTNHYYGWAVGDAGTILRTTDGGDTWVLHDVGTIYGFTSITAFPSGQAWVGGDAGNVLYWSSTEQPTIYVSSPNGGETWTVGELHPITWSTQGSEANVKIELNRNYPGATWETLVASTANDGMWDWTVIGTVTATARIRISDITNSSVADMSDADFVIDACYSGNVSGTWYQWQSPVMICGDVTVSAGDTLVIEPGVHVEFQGHYKLRVDSNATLRAIGTEQDSIVFTATNPTTGWGGIRFLSVASTCQLEYCHLTYGRASGPAEDVYGGAIYCWQSNPEIQNCLIENSTADYAGGGIACLYSSPNISNCTIRACSAPFTGGIFCHYSSTATISNNMISGNSATSYAGGGIFVGSSNPSISGNTISSNYAHDFGGGISVEYSSSPTISGNTISGNTGNLGGGGISVASGSSPIIIGNTISSNSVGNGNGWNGGGIRCEGSSPIISNNVISGNHTGWDGGGVSIGSSGGELRNNTITWNTASQACGGIFCGPNTSNLTIYGNLIAYNSTSGRGGGIVCWNNASPIIRCDTIRNNSALGNGGGISCGEDGGSCNPLIDSCMIVANVASGSGGGIFCVNYSSASITANIISGNSASGGSGGGIYCTGSSPLISGNTISENSARDWGGGILSYSNASPTISHNRISGNSTAHGGGIFGGAGLNVIEFNEIACNTASGGGGGVYLSSTSPTMNRNTIAHNHAGSGGGLYCDASSPNLRNCILWGDSAQTSPMVHRTGGGTVQICYSDLQELWSGCSGNISQDPLFVDPVGGPVCGDFHLTAGSPCIDTGDPSSPHDPDSTVVDMGAYYFHHAGPSMTVTRPSGGETLVVGDVDTIRWVSAWLSGGVRVELNRDYPGGLWDVLTDSTANTGAFPWTVTTPVTQAARVRVTSISLPAVGDTSNANFTIGIRALTLTSPVGGESWYVGQYRGITWNSTNFSETIRIEINRNYPSGTWDTLVTNVPNTGSRSWTVDGPATTQARIRVLGESHPAVGDTSDDDFSIGMPTLTLLRPNSGETSWITNTDSVQWTSTNLTGNVHVELNRSFPSGEWESLAASTLNDGLHHWVVSGPISDSARIRVMSGAVAGVGDTSDLEFSIQPPTLTLLHPVGGDSLYVTNPDTIRWSWLHLSGNIIIDLNRTFPSATWEPIAASTGNDGNEVWIVNAPLSESCRMRVRSQSAPEIGDTSESDLSIVAPLINLTLPNGGEHWYVTRPDTIRWTTSRLQGNVTIQLNREFPGPAWETVAANVPNDGEQAWTVTEPTATAARLRLLSSLEPTLGDTTDTDFEIVYPTITIVDPNGGDTVAIGADRLILWATQIGAGSVRIELNRDFPSPTWETLSASTANDGSFTWLVAYPETDHARVRIMSTALPSIGDTSNADFIIPPPSPAQLPGLAGNPFPTEADIISSPLPLISWSPAAQTLNYDFYFWPDSTTMPSTPTSALQTNTYFQVTTPLQSGRSYHWTVIARNLYGETPGPQWSFRLRALPDLRVDTVMVNQAYSGQPLQVTWRVTNYGQGPTSTPEWFDRIWLSGDLVVDIDEPEDVLFGQFGNVTALAPGESYSNTQSVLLPDTTVGTHYIWVITDNLDAFVVDLQAWCAQSHSYGPVVEAVECNNFDYAPVYINESPTPDLRVTSLAVAPSNSYSGDTVHVQWTVNNGGSVPTQVANWSDGIYFSADSSVSANDVLIAVQPHSGGLSGGAEYVSTRSAPLPANAIDTGYVIVKADLYNAVLESEEFNNSGLSNPIHITLTPPPDLVVDSISASPYVANRDTMTVGWRVRNQGSGPTRESGWNDRVYLSSDSILDPGSDHVLGTPSHAGLLDAGASYFRESIVIIPNGWYGASYLFVATDYNAQVFENEADSNNFMRAASTMFIDSPDLTITALTAPDSASVRQSVLMDWTVTNLGPAALISGSWNDRVYLSADSIFSPGTDAVLTTLPRSSGLLPPESYHATAAVAIPNQIAGPYFVFVRTDDSDQISENQLEANNVRRGTSPIEVLCPNLSVTAVQAPDSAGVRASITIEWTTINSGPGTLLASVWNDRAYLSADTVFSPASDFAIGTIARTDTVDPGESYLASAVVTVPDGIAGTYYVFLKTDWNNLVFENSSESDNIRRAAGPTEITFPDLSVSSVIVPAVANSGDSLAVEWAVENRGNGPLVTTTWTDRVYLSLEPDFNPATATVLGSILRSGTLAADSTYTRQSRFLLPNGISGPYYVHVKADALDQIFENLHDADNVARCDSAMQVALSPWPDLVVTLITVPLEATAGDLLPVSVAIADSGSAAAPAVLWSDKLFLSTSSTWYPPSNLELVSVAHNGPLAAGDSYSIARTFTLPSSYAGTYYVYAQTDANNSVFEHIDEANNIVRSAAITVLPYPAVDLSVTEVALPDTISTGQSFLLQWTVQNVGLARTLASSWSDVAYLSTDTTLELGSDLLLVSASHYGALDASYSYSESRAVTIPNGFAGTRYVIIRTDIAGAVVDVNPANNGRVAPTALEVIESPWADLTVAQFTADTAGTAGQSIDLSWTVTNIGPGSTLVTPWYDAVFLSLNTVLETGDIRLLTYAASGPLAGDSSYSVSMPAELPSFVSGNYYLLLSADNSGVLYEQGAESDNLSFRPIWIALMPPADLIVSGIQIPDSTSPGDSVTVSWTLVNAGTNPAAGVMRDGVYFSRDTTWDLNDPLLALVDRAINIAPGGGLAVSAVVRPAEAIREREHRGLDDERSGENEATSDRTPGLDPGLYHAIVRTNLRDNIRESNYDNNSAASATTVDVVVPQLLFGEPSTFALGAGEQRYFRVEAQAGLDLYFNMTGNVEGAMNELYAAFARIPTLLDADFVADEPFATEQVLLLPAVQTGTWYVMAVARSLPPPLTSEELTLSGSLLPFSALTINPSQGGADGSVTCLLSGAGFDSTLQVSLALPDTVYEARVMDLISRTQALINWDLTGAPTGAFDLICSRADSLQTLLLGGFTVAQPVRAVEASIHGPSVMRTQRDYLYELVAVNTGNVDLTNVRLLTSVPPGVGYKLGDTASFVFPDTAAIVEALLLQLPAAATHAVSLSLYPQSPLGSSTIDVSALEPSARLGFETEYLGHLFTGPVDTSGGLPPPPTGCNQYASPVLWSPADACPGYFDYFRTSDSSGAAQGDVWGLRTNDNHVNLLWGSMSADNEGRVIPGTGRMQEFPLNDLVAGITLMWNNQAVRFEYCFSVQPVPDSVMPALVQTISDNLALRGGSDACYCDHPSFNDLTGLCTVCGSLCMSSLDNAMWLSYHNSTIVPPDGSLEQVMEDWLVGNLQPAIGATDLLADFESGLVDEDLWETMRRRLRNGRTVVIRLVASQDPNTITGPAGFGDAHWVSRDETYTYTINFENLQSESSAPAQFVRIVQTLDPALNLSSFRVGEIRFANMTFAVPANRAYFSRRLDLRDSLGVFVDVTAGVDVGRDELFWLFESIDPATGQQPLNPLLGFLPVNDSLHHRGEGRVSYTVEALQNAVPLDTITAAALITFDVNDPITTPPIFNTLDALPPASRVDSLPTYIDSTLFLVQWSGADDPGGSGIASYDLYVSVNDGPFTLAQDALTDTALVFNGLLYNSYGFFTRARDQVGNIEPNKSLAEASVYLTLPPPSQSVSDLVITAARIDLTLQATLRWSAVRTDTLGNPVTVDEYRIYSQVGALGGDSWTLLTTTTDTSYTYSLAGDSTGTLRFFQVIAFRAGTVLLRIPHSMERIQSAPALRRQRALEPGSPVRPTPATERRR